MADRLDWRGPQAEAAVLALFVRRLRAAAITVQNRARVLLSVAGTGVRTKQGTVAAGPGAKGKRVYGFDRSKPGEPPRKQTGRLRASVAYEVVGLVARVGTNVLYGLVLELGLGKLRGAARPWLRRALIESQGEVHRILGGR